MSATTQDVRTAWRIRLVATSAVLVALTFVQQPGRVVTDTKLDLSVDPGGFLARALTLWDPDGALGQVQNQAYGYLFPMGPFFWLGHLASLDPWVVQRLWWSLVLVTAFLGTVKLCSALGVGTPWARIVAGLAFALSPRMLTVIGPSSIEVWPSALAPWVLVPLVIGVRRGSPRQMAALSALAVACVGGVNAAATFAVVPLGALWLLVQPPSARRRQLMVWWPLLVLVGCLWWLLPLFLLGAYSPPFLDFIESASTTTFAGTLVDALRGTTNWTAYVSPDSVAGGALLRDATVVANGVVVVALGAAGLVRRDNRHRTFLLLGLLLGLVLVTAGHTGAVQGVAAGHVENLLDGVLAPLRNNHKLDPVVRLPLVLGLAHLLGSLSRAHGARVGGSARRRDPFAVGVAALAVVALAGATAPAWTSQLAPRGSFDQVPDYWTQASSWLAGRDDGRGALLLPGTPFGDYQWGRTGDEPLQPLAGSPWTVRNAVPLTPGRSIDALDAIGARFATGRGSQGLASTLRRSGVSYLVVRNDLARDAGAIDPELVYATLRTTPGVRSVASFGPDLGGEATLRPGGGDRVFVNRGWQAVHPAVEVFALDDPASRASVQATASTPVVVGGGPSLLTLDDLGLTRDRDVVMAADADPSSRPPLLVLTDGQRRQEAAFGLSNHNRSNTLAVDEPYRADRAVHAYDPDDVSTTTPLLRGARSLRASSSSSDVTTLSQIDPAAQPWSALDGDPSTQWRASVSDDTTAWLELGLERPTVVRDVELTLGGDDTRRRSVTVSTDRGSARAVLRPGTPGRVRLPSGRTTSVRVSGTSTAASPLAVAELVVPGVEVTRPLVLPSMPGAWGAPDRVVLAADDAHADGCIRVSGVIQCAPARAAQAEDETTIDRIVPATERRTYPASVRVAGRGGAALDSLVQRDRLARVTASSRALAAPVAGAASAIDGDPTTSWVADPEDGDPTLTLQWVGEREIDSVRVRTAGDVAASTPTRVRVVSRTGESREAELVDGTATFDPLTTDVLEVHLATDRPTNDLGFDGVGTELPIGVSEISLPGRRLFPVDVSSTPEAFGCGSGPSIRVGATVLRTELVGSRSALQAGDEVRADPCDAEEVTLQAGRTRVTVDATDALRPTTVVLGGTASIGATSDEADVVGAWGASSRDLDLSTGQGRERLVTVRENVNAGWAGRSDRGDGRSVTVNGWQQGYVVDGRAEELRLRFELDDSYRAGLGLGLLLLVLLVVLGGLRGREDAPPARGRRGRRWTRGVVGTSVVVAALLVAGLPGLAAAGLGAALLAAVRRFAPGQDVAPWVAATLLVVAGSAYVVRPWGAPDGWAGDLAWPQLVAASCLGVLASAVLCLRPTSLSRSAGRSTTR
ncbi:alpha-(1-_3)-arabinofuranosyltransferase domain-containing protein [Solicola sp. PLA-1-18]|uniref:alpha-(1->3)-arabinofuranosyltransferase domain-containing protein n=1 Tax=Solicola sp. PLA-1-18 TaxID=3380532 RepID=UPI003B794102